MAGLFEEFNPVQRIARNQYGPQGLVDTRTQEGFGKVNRGSLISFHYPVSWAVIPNVIHDPYPMLIITDIWPQYIRGLNLHYLTFPYIKNILEIYGGRNITWDTIKPDNYMAQAFRMYVRQGIRKPRLLDLPWLQAVLQEAKSFNPGEVEKIRMSIQQQIQNRLQAKADELTSYEEWRANLDASQKRQLRGKGLDVQRILTGGVDQNLTVPNQATNPQLPLPVEPDENL
jgi:hypothetical protein